MKVLSCADIRTLIQRIGIRPFLERAITALEQDFGRWHEFQLSSRHASHFPQGVIELMPCADRHRYSFKYVNGHPGNTAAGKLSVIAIGLLADIEDGYPLLLTEMTLLTAVRTAAVTALAARYLARLESTRLALIGTGAQAEFQALATGLVLPISSVRYHDTDGDAMAKFSRNMAAYAAANDGQSGHRLELVACGSTAEAVAGADMVITATADKRRARVLTSAMLHQGLHIHGLGGDCPGKTELDPDILRRCRIVVEYLEQTRTEGEIQNAPDAAVDVEPAPLETVPVEIWQLVCGQRPGRETGEEITLFDAVGFALEDFSIINLVYRLAEELDVGRSLGLIPEPADPKDLFGYLL